MAEESFLLVSLKEEKAKKLAQVLSNDTSRKILEFLTNNKRATETEISKKLSIPLSTVHYNIGHLASSGLINNDEFNYSEKGKEVIHYSLSNKYVIIAPNNIEGLKEKLQKILPVVAILSFGSFIISKLGTLPNNNFMLSKTGESASRMMADESVAEMAPMAAQQIMPEISTTTTEPNIALWFFIGGLFTLIVYFLWLKLYNRKKS
ncbi:helix-turn-helix transcriptional regulator [archaeon]|jgi:DNA-binding Lrp family transcriptional regulator|nr:helix-turn-helix transcriptional regulator [archaeon]MBT4647881.1 helix-turn-helix transcriptional regulator [archaeon]MBT6821597.1 helix-turn-helix transcriptional regulator [archaeon]